MECFYSKEVTVWESRACFLNMRRFTNAALLSKRSGCLGKKGLFPKQGPLYEYSTAIQKKCLFGKAGLIS